MKLNRLWHVGAAAILTAAMTAVVPGGISVVEAAQQKEGEKKETRRVPSISEKVHKKLAEAQVFLDLDPPDITSAFGVLDQLKTKKGLNDYENALIWNMYGYGYYTREDYPAAVRAYRQLLSYKLIPEAIEYQTMYTVGQLYFVMEDYGSAIDMLNQWFAVATNPGPRAYVFLAQAYYQMGRYQEAIPIVWQAIDVANARGTEVKENWYLLLRAMYFEMQDIDEVLKIQETLIATWNKPAYWPELAGFYGEKEMYDRQLATLYVANMKGWLEKPVHKLVLSQLLLQADIPYEAGIYLEQAMAIRSEELRVEKTRQNLQLLSQSWVMAQEQDKAVPALKEAARVAEDGDLYINLAHMLLDREEWAGAEKAVQDAIDKGGLRRRDQAFVTLGIARFEREKFNDAIRAFREAAKDKRSRKIANQWIKYIRGEITRRDELRKAEEAFANL